MFNLTVDEAHTFYVGKQGWLVHNAGTDCGDAWRWASSKLRKTAEDISGNLAVKGKEVTVASREEAEQLILGLFTGYKNTTGLSGNAVRQLNGTKAGTYHWDSAIDTATGRLTGHSAVNPYESMPHVQVYTPEGGHITIYFPAKK